MQAIVVKYIGPTNTRSARMKASANRLLPSVTRAYDSELSVVLNARQCAQDFIKRMGWHPNTPDGPNLYGPFWALGELPNGDYVFVNHSAKPHMDEYSIDTRSWG